MLTVQIKKLCERAVLPTFAHEDDAGMDLYAVEDATLAPLARGQIKTGIAASIPRGHAGLIWDKSGLSHRHGLKTLGGVVDAGFRGEILVGVVNLSDEAYTVRAGDKIAQLLIQKVEHVRMAEVGELDDTQRGEGGFGSSGT